MKKINILCCDMPWSFSDKLEMSEVARGAEANYSTMTIQNIKNMKIKEIVDPNGCILAMWVPSSLLQEGLDIMKHWGFTQKQTYIWVKTKKKESIKDVLYKSIKNIKDIKTLKSTIDSINSDIVNLLGFGMGRLFRQSHEICLIGTNNNGIYKKLKNKSQRSVSFGENLKHSAKPECLYDSLDQMFPDKENVKLELFARRHKNNWICIGNQAPMSEGEDVILSIEKLIKATSSDLELSLDDIDVLKQQWKSII